MKVAVVYNKDQTGYINIFGIQNKEWYPEKTIHKVVSALEKGGHEVELILAGRNLFAQLNKFLPKLSKRRPNGIVFNMALGVQGKGRYTHVPAMLEVAGIPYTGSSPEGHILALDKVVAKQILHAAGIPTPKYRVVMEADRKIPELQFPLIVKPRSEAASFGLKVVKDEPSLREALEEIIGEYKQPALVEEFIQGREVNVAILGNCPPQALPVLEIVFPDEENRIYDYDIKFLASAKKKVKKVCPADLPKETAALIQKIAVETFQVLNVFDFARVDFRLDEYNRPFVLELNSMASVNPGSSFVAAAKTAGYSYDRLINRIVDVAVERYAVEEPDYFGENNCALKNNKRS